MKPKADWKGCPVRYAAGVLGDPWSLLLLRDLMFKGRRHFREFAAEERPASNVVSERLARLEAAGIIRRRSDPARRNQGICELTAKGMDLVPVFLAMIDWSSRHDAETEAPADFLLSYRADPAGFATSIMQQLAARADG